MDMRLDAVHGVFVPVEQASEYWELPPLRLIDDVKQGRRPGRLSIDGWQVLVPVPERPAPARSPEAPPAAPITIGQAPGSDPWRLSRLTGLALRLAVAALPALLLLGVACGGMVIALRMALEAGA